MLLLIGNHGNNLLTLVYMENVCLMNRSIRTTYMFNQKCFPLIKCGLTRKKVKMK